MVGTLWTSTWIGPLLCFALWLSDYELTVIGARLYKAQDKVVFAGSYELNPRTQSDVDALRTIGPRILLKPLSVALIAVFVGALARAGKVSYGGYALVLGAFLLAQLVVHFRHIQNLYLFKRVVPAAKGRIEYPRGLRSSALQFAMFAAIFVALFVVTGSLFILGGACMCCVNAAIHYRLALKHEATLSRAA